MIYAAVFLLILATDIISKLWTVNVLKAAGSISLLKGIFHLTYVENRGAAFGMLQNGRVFFIVITLLLLAATIYFAPRIFGKSKVLDFGAVFVLAGAMGNLVDRIFRGFVVDMLDFCLIDFPVFNVADIFVCVGAFLICIYILFFDESSKKKKGTDGNDL